MTHVLPKNSHLVIRAAQYRDLDTIERLCSEALESDSLTYSIRPDKPLKRLQSWPGWLKWVGMVFNPLQRLFGVYLVEQGNKIQGVIRVSPFNRTRSTWRVDQVCVSHNAAAPEEATVSQKDEPRSPIPSLSEAGSQLLRHCFEKIWEARTWMLEVNINDKALLALYRQNGFQPLAQMTYWSIAPEVLQELAEREPDLPNLLPVSNADAPLLYQLDTASMPPLVRQVFDRHILDFKNSLFRSLLEGFKNWLDQVEVVSGYVFEPQRKAAIGYFQIRFCRNGSQAHQAQLTVHPAYTWLYPELTAQMARIAQDFPAQELQLPSSDYQPEREEYLERAGASRIAHTLMMSRSVWHKLRESKTVVEALQLSEMLQGLQPSRKPVPGRMSLLRSVQKPASTTKAEASPSMQTTAEPTRKNTKPLLNLSSQSDISDPPPEEPCC